LRGAEALPDLGGDRLVGRPRENWPLDRPAAPEFAELTIC
jgi:hypothetical protein